MQDKAQTWECSVYILGGALNLLKNFYFAVHWRFQSNGQLVISTINNDPHIDIHLTQGANQSTATPVSRIKNMEGKRTLGVRLAPDGSDKTEHAFHLKDATKLHSCLLNAPLNKESTQIGFMGSMILQKFGYPLGATCFKQEECLEIQQKFPPTILSKMGINESTPTNIRSGPAMFAGMKVPELWTIQGSTKNKLMINTSVRLMSLVTPLLSALTVSNYKQELLGKSLAAKDPLSELTLTDAGHLTCGNSMTATISPSTAKINLGFSPNKNMTNSSWKLSLVSQKLQRND
jgi:hypothetical protein